MCARISARVRTGRGWVTFALPTFVLAVLGLIVAGWPAEAEAQDLRRMEPMTVESERSDRSTSTAASSPSAGSSEPEVLHITDHLMNRPEGRRALRRYREALRAGVRSAKTSEPVEYSVGDTASFNVYRSDSSDYRYDVPFVLKETSPDFFLWVEVAELDSTDGDPPHVRERDVDSLYHSLEESTPPGSYDPDAGIIDVTESVFGEPGDRDGNGRVHILLTDIKDGWDGSGAYVAGFFNPSDLDFNATGSNQGEFLYLDTYPAIYSGDGYEIADQLRSTAAHEYQHLIHAAYDAVELTFVNEGQSEWAEVVNGFDPRTMAYLSSPDTVSGYNTYLFDWSDGTSSEVLYDYQRAGLLTHYIAERLGTEATGRITRINEIGEAGYEAAFDSAGRPEWTLPDVLGWFHTANLLNDRSLDERYGYQAASRAGLAAEPEPVYDGRTESSTPERSLEIRPGAVRYVRWESVEDLSVTLEADTSSGEVAFKTAEDGPSAEKIRSWIDASMILRDDQGQVVFDSVEVGTESKSFEGSYQSATLVLVHRQAEQNLAGTGPAARNAPLRYSASWTAPEESFETKTLTHAGTRVAENDDGALFISMSDEARQATWFEVPSPEDAVLQGIDVAPFYCDQFSNCTPEQPTRNFTLHVWGTDPNGAPGAELASTVVENSHASPLGSTYDYLSVDLEGRGAAIDSPPDTLYVGISNSGSDDNQLVLGPSDYPPGENNSYLWTDAGGSDYQWVPLGALSVVSSTDTTRLDSMTLPVRAEFLIRTSTATTRAEIGEVPEEFELASNYPNPFNPTTQIPYQLPARAEVDLTVYDALGRRVAVLVEGEQPPGRYVVTVDAGDWPSGVYMYMLRADERVRTGKMTLMK